jgi:hypothetical protein
MIPSSSPPAGRYVQIYRITMEFISKLLLPGVLVFVILTFRPTINALLSKTTKAEFAGAKFEFVQKIEEAVKSGDSKKADDTFLKFRSEISEDALWKFWKPDGQHINQDHQARIRKWMEDNNITEQSITVFMRSDIHAKAREQAIKDLGIGR